MAGAWNNLTMREKAGFIKIGVDNGLTSLSDIQSAYNKFAEGGAFGNKQVRKFKDGGEEKKHETVKATPIRNDIEFVDTDRLQVDKYGNVLNPDTNHYGAVILPDVVVTGYGNGRAYYTDPNDRRLAELIRDENRRKEAYKQIYGTDEGFYMSPFAINDKPLESVYPEFDLITLGQGLGLENLIKRGISSTARKKALASMDIPTSFRKLSFSPEVSKDLLKEYKQIYKQNILDPELLKKVMDYTGLSMEEVIQMQSKNFYKALLDSNSKKVKYLLGNPENFGAMKEFNEVKALPKYKANKQNALRDAKGNPIFEGNNYEGIFEISDLPLDQTTLALKDVPYFISYHGGSKESQKLGRFVLPNDPLYNHRLKLRTDQGFYTTPVKDNAINYTMIRENPTVYNMPIFGKPYLTDMWGTTEIRPVGWISRKNPDIKTIPESVFAELKSRGYDYIYYPWESQEIAQNNPAFLKVLKGSNGNFDITDASSMFHALGGQIYDGDGNKSQEVTIPMNLVDMLDSSTQEDIWEGKSIVQGSIPLQNFPSWNNYTPEQKAWIQEYYGPTISQPYISDEEYAELENDYNKRLQKHNRSILESYDALVAEGLSDETIAAYLGNILQESSGNYKSRTPLFYGLFHYDKPSQEKYFAWLESNKKTDSPSNQIYYELHVNSNGTPFTNMEKHGEEGKAAAEEYRKNRTANSKYKKATQDQYYAGVSNDIADWVIKNGYDLNTRTLGVLQRHIIAGKPEFYKRAAFANLIYNTIQNEKWREQYNNKK